MYIPPLPHLALTFLDALTCVNTFPKFPTTTTYPTYLATLTSPTSGLSYHTYHSYNSWVLDVCICEVKHEEYFNLLDCLVSKCLEIDDLNLEILA